MKRDIFLVFMCNIGHVKSYAHIILQKITTLGYVSLTCYKRSNLSGSVKAYKKTRLLHYKPEWYYRNQYQKAYVEGITDVLLRWNR
jgi:hypothetical protein